MEELKNENAEEQPVVEQRPSTKYGRTAYQQQLQQEQEAQNKQASTAQNVYSQTQQNDYQQWSNLNNSYTMYQEPKVALNAIYAKILMILVALNGVLSFVGTMLGLKAYGNAESIEEMYEQLAALMEMPVYSVLDMVSSLVFWGMLMLIILDIMQLKKANYKITGAVLFAIFLRPAYFAWRAHLLGEKKTLQILYAVGVYLLSVIEYSIAFYYAFEMVMRIM